MSSKTICECCGKEIKDDERAVEIRYGKIYGYAKPPNRRVEYRKNKVDFFHASCDIAIRKE